MSHAKRDKLVYTVPDRCRVCYTCVRECPVKAIRIINGQAEIMSERCIGCGSCIKVCSQGAKAMIDTKSNVKEILENNSKVIACVAPSFPAEFTDIKDYRKFVGMMRSLGFSKVIEVSFGADLVALEYKKLKENNGTKNFISSDCPAIVFYIEHYMPDSIDSLAPIVSPMVGITRVAKEMYGNDHKIIFVGPCIAKKAESDEIDEAITFKEIRELFLEKNIQAQTAIESEFDPPFSGKGSIFPVSRGMLNTIGETDDLVESNVIVTAGSHNFKDILKEFEDKTLGNKHLELLCCEGCIMGPGMSTHGKLYSRRHIVSEYVKSKLTKLDNLQFDQQIERFEKLDFSQSFQKLDRRLIKPEYSNIQQVLISMNKIDQKDQLNCGACGYDTCLNHAEAIINGLAEAEMCLPYSIEQLHNSIAQLNVTNEELADARQALIQSEKLASMGQLSAGIAHELNNPLGVITIYSNILKDELKEGDPNIKDLELIVEQAERCKKIVGGLLNFARKNQVNLKLTNMAEFCKRGIKSTLHPKEIKLNFSSSVNNPDAFIDKDQMMQVLTNLLKNAVESIVSEGFVNVVLSGNEENIIIEIKDNGCGISEENMHKIYTPFFTTKAAGKGTGLGLPLVYGIIKMHKGDIFVKSNADENKGSTGTIFKITLPRKTIN